jgi:hypothetical protein
MGARVLLSISFSGDLAMRSLFALMLVCAAMFVAGCGEKATTTTTTTPPANETETTPPAEGTTTPPAGGATQ